MKRSLYTLLLSESLVPSCCGQDLGSDLNGALTLIHHIPTVLWCSLGQVSTLHPKMGEKGSTSVGRGHTLQKQIGCFNH